MEYTTIHMLDQFVATKPGEPYRWLPFGTIVKGSKRRELTPELAATFKLPHFKPPIKLGSHDDTTPAGGHIVGFEIRADGIWVTPELVPAGSTAFLEGQYRYHSPEVVWEGELEDPVTGEMVQGPFIWGDALLHTPHLGEQAAFFEASVNPSDSGGNTMEDMVQVPVSFWDKVVGRIFGEREHEPQPEPQPEPLTAETPDVDEYEAVKVERDNLAAELAAIKREREAAEIGRASWRERVQISVVAVSLKKTPKPST